MQRDVNQATREEWRALGFFYYSNDGAKEWRLVGSHSGLLKFRDLLLDYVADPRNIRESEHEHYGPYKYLEIMTYREAGFDNHAIRGTLDDLTRLARLVEIKLTAARPGSTIHIQDEFAVDSAYSLVLEVREDGFDPAAADSMLPK